MSATATANATTSIPKKVQTKRGNDIEMNHKMRGTLYQ